MLKMKCFQPTGIKIPEDIQTNFGYNAEYDAEKWPLVHIKRLLRFYAAHRCLWDVNCKDNRNRKMRHAAIVDITAALNIGVTKELVVQKINILRNTYRYEKKRIKQRIRRGLGASTKLKWFALADAFLRKVPKKGKKEMVSGEERSSTVLGCLFNSIQILNSNPIDKNLKFYELNMLG